MNTKTKIRRGTLITCLAIVAVLATAGVVVADNVGLAPAPQQPPVASVPAEISAAFGVFRRPATAADSSEGVLSGSGSGAGVSEALGHAAANVYLSRHVGGADAGAFATVGRERVCLYAAGESSCAEPTVALKGEMVEFDVCSSGLPAGHIRISGLVLDGVSNVTLKDTEGKETLVPVRENGFSTLIGGHITDMDWTKEGVVHKVPITYSASMANSCVSN